MSPRNAATIGARRFYDDPNDPTHKVLSVTTLLGKTYPQEWLGPYYAKHVAERAVFSFTELRARLDSDDPIDWTLKWLKAAPAQRRDAAGDAGTNLHAYLEGRLNETISADDADDEGLTPAEIAIEQFLAVYRPEPVFVEAQVMSHTYDYAGSLDAIVDIYGKRFLLDLKTSNAYDPLADKPVPAGGDHKDRLQLAAYRYADFIFEDDRVIAPMPDVDGCLILAVPRDHPQMWRPIEVEAGPGEHRAFLKFADAFRWYEGNNKTPIGSQLLPQTREAA